ncbi:MAG: polysaccharide biosynthesis/export family protein, partial [Candidatus Eremiobacteraeota bacterium]|nr:polysaccharide biosynthesis/export family protein [Candidatus Eremiobacteraeota bacterium]
VFMPPVANAATDEYFTPGKPASPPATVINTINNNPLVPNARIQPGDQLSVEVYGDPTLSQSVPVMADGTIAYPLIGRVAVTGKTPDEASHLLAERLSAFVKHPSVTVAIAAMGQMNVLVLGNVKAAGKYLIRSGGHLTDALAAAGGLGPTDGALPVVRITQGDGNIRQVSLQKLLHDGDDSLNVALDNNAIVYVGGPNAYQIEVLGAVDRPGVVQLNEGDRLSAAIARAGTSSNTFSDLNHVIVTRTDHEGRTASHEVDMYRALRGGDLRYDPILVKGDIVYVPEGRRPLSAGGISPLTVIWRLIGL